MSSINPLQIVAVVFALLLIASILRRLDDLLHRIGQLLLGAVCGFTIAMLLINVKHVAKEPAAALGVIGGALIVAVSKPRGRYIPAKERRRAIARYELETGKKYNSRKHDLDHEIPFSKGGNSNAENLRVTDRRKNRSKGARSTWWDPFG